MINYRKITWAQYYPMYKEYEHPPSTIFHKLISKNLAKVITFVSLRLRLSPNAMSLISAGLILIATAMIFVLQGSQFSAVVFVILTQISYAIDCSDGVVARITNKGSKFGAFFDLTLDRFVVLFFYLGIGLYHFYNNHSGNQLSLEIIIGFLSMAIYLQYQLATSFMAYIMPNMKGYVKNNKKWSFQEKVLRIIYEFIDTGIFYFILGVSMLFNYEFYAVFFYGFLGSLLTVALYILLYKKYKNIK